MTLSSHKQSGVKIEDCAVAGAVHLCFESYPAASKYLASADKSSLALISGKPRDSQPVLKLVEAGKKVVFLDFSEQAGIIEHDAGDQVITVEGGISFEALDQHLKSTGQYWPVMPPDRSVSVTEIAAFGLGGPLEHRFGGPRDLVLGAQVMLAGGETIKCGGRVVKNVTGYDMTRLFVGAAGSLGLIGQCHLRCFARPEESKTLLAGMKTWQEAFDKAQRIMQSGLPVDCLEIFANRLNAGMDLAGFDICLAVKASGACRVVDEILDAVKPFAAGTSEYLEVEPDREEAFWLSVAGLSGVADGLTAVMPDAMLKEFLKVNDNQDIIAMVRPGRGKLKLKSEYLDSVRRLRRLAKESAQPATIAYACDDFEYRVERLGSSESHAQEIIATIKNRLDPTACLNPQVKV